MKKYVLPLFTLLSLSSALRAEMYVGGGLGIATLSEKRSMSELNLNNPLQNTPLKDHYKAGSSNVAFKGLFGYRTQSDSFVYGGEFFLGYNANKKEVSETVTATDTTNKSKLSQPCSMGILGFGGYTYGDVTLLGKLGIGGQLFCFQWQEIDNTNGDSLTFKNRRLTPNLLLGLSAEMPVNQGMRLVADYTCALPVFKKDVTTKHQSVVNGDTWHTVQTAHNPTTHSFTLGATFAF